MIIIGHRGIPEKRTENSLEGFSLLPGLGILAVEFDIQLSLDQIPIVFHDETFDRLCVTQGSGHQNKGPSQITYHCFPRLIDGQKIPTLREVLKTLVDEQTNGHTGPLTVHAEIKTDAGKDLSPIWNDLVFYKDKLNVIVSSFHFDVIDQARQQGFSVLMLFDEIDRLDQNIDNYLQKRHGRMIGLSIKSLTKKTMSARADLINKIHSNHAQVFVYTVNSIEDMALLKEIGADGIYSDYPDHLLKHQQNKKNKKGRP